ncbi:MAG TPA: phosphoribosylaminoimidazolesuccinocarboxamide synthase [Longimicrobiales bacterium]
MVIASTRLPFPLVARGKVRDVYDVGGGRLLMVATDRISAFDVVLPQPIPHKGEVLTLITAWWLARLEDITPNHLISVDPEAIAREVPALAGLEAEWARRAMLVRRTEPFPVECVVRGYIAGSAWAEYRRTGTLAGEPLPPGLVESARLEPPIFSPATKAVEGHDENITFDGVRERVGADTAELLRERSLAIYARGRELAAAAGIIVADTKFEFGRLPDGTVLLIDEVLTPDSSRFWPAERYAPGRAQPSLDKQPVRDYLESLVARGAWDKRPPAPELPPDVVEATSRRYRDVFQRLTGYALEDFPAHDPAQPPERGGR